MPAFCNHRASLLIMVHFENLHYKEIITNERVIVRTSCVNSLNVLLQIQIIISQVFRILYL